MTEFQIDINDQIKAGLRRDTRDNTTGLAVCKNMQPTEDGLRPYEPPDLAVSNSELSNNGITVSFPYPQVFIGKQEALLCTQTRIFSIDLSTFTLTELTIYDGNDADSMVTLTGGSSWHFMDFHTTWALFNGTELVFKDGRFGFSGSVGKVLRLTSPVIKTGCDFKYRPIYGGFTSNPFDEEWQNFFHVDPAKTGIGEQELSLGKNSVFFGSPGGGDMLWLLYPRLLTGGYVNDPEVWNSLRTYAFDRLKQNTMGWLILNSPGEVLRVLPLFDRLMVYSEDAVHGMPSMLEPVVTLGMRREVNVGIESRSAAGGYEGRHLFVDTQGYLWEVVPEQAPTKLGYSEFLSGMSNIVITYVPSEEHGVEGDFYISDANSCFVFRDGRLSEVSRLVTSAGRFSGNALGIYEETGAGGAEDTAVEIVSNTLKGTAGTRTLTSISVLGKEDVTPRTLKAALDYTHKMNETFTRTPAVQMNDEGIGYPHADGYAHRLVVTADDYQVLEIDELQFTVQFDDRRNIRGPTGTQTNREREDLRRI